MTVSLAEFGLDQLSVEDKLELAGRLWDDVVTAGPPGALLSDAQREELRRRVAHAKANPDDYVAWEDVLAASLKRLAQ
jgi:putative addiction module component (TIGR02574 family)